MKVYGILYDSSKWGWHVYRCCFFLGWLWSGFCSKSGMKTRRSCSWDGREKEAYTKKCACSKCRWIIKKAYEKPQANIPLRTHTHISSTPNEVSTLDSCSRSPRPFVRQILNFIQNALGGNVGWSWSHLMIVYFPFRKSRPVFFCCLPLPSFTGHI